MGQAIMLQGTASSVGKTLLGTALCRIYSQAGYKVAPFKAQNMASHMFQISEQAIISPSQALQARAAGIEPEVAMNPIFLKPVDDIRSEVFVLGRKIGTMSAQEYIAYKPNLLQSIERSLLDLKAKYDLIIIEGAGSPAEVNLREHDLVNMRVAKLAQAPVFLVADIDLGGVFASVHGTLKLLLPEERKYVAGVIVNKFRGKPQSFSDGARILAELAQVPVLGVVPYFPNLNLETEVGLANLASQVQECLNFDLFTHSMAWGFKND